MLLAKTIVSLIEMWARFWGHILSPHSQTSPVHVSSLPPRVSHPQGWCRPVVALWQYADQHQPCYGGGAQPAGGAPDGGGRGDQEEGGSSLVR